MFNHGSGAAWKLLVFAFKQFYIDPVNNFENSDYFFSQIFDHLGLFTAAKGFYLKDCYYNFPPSS